jgi:hypothetical protein
VVGKRVEQINQWLQEIRSGRSMTAVVNVTDMARFNFGLKEFRHIRQWGRSLNLFMLCVATSPDSFTT